MISEDFTRDEFECPCGCGFDTVDVELANVLQGLRDHFGEKVIVTSACRCPVYNEKVGGSPRSQHLKGRAGDVLVENVPPHIVYAYLNARYPDRYGIGSYHTFTHIDTRTNGPARW